MEDYMQIEDIFDEEKKEQVLSRQGDYINTLADIAKKCLILKKNEEAEAIPYLKCTSSFIEKMLDLDDFVVYLDQFPEIKQAMLNKFFPELMRIIKTVSFFALFGLFFILMLFWLFLAFLAFFEILAVWLVSWLS